MSRWGGTAIAIGLLAIAAALALPTVLGPEDSTEVGRFVLVQTAPGVVYRIDTATGDAWVSEQGGDWRVVEEPEEAPGDLRPSSVHPRHRTSPDRAGGARLVGAKLERVR